MMYTETPRSAANDSPVRNQRNGVTRQT
jgi:hypothetical protein